VLQLLEILCSTQVLSIIEGSVEMRVTPLNLRLQQYPQKKWNWEFG